MSGVYKVIGQFQAADGTPLTGAGYKVGLRDKDRLFDDKLGETGLNAQGEAEFIFYAADILSIDSVGERRPDLYFIVWKDGREVYRSEVLEDVDFEAEDPVTGRKDDLTRVFGPYRVGA